MLCRKIGNLIFWKDYLVDRLTIEPGTALLPSSRNVAQAILFGFMNEMKTRWLHILLLASSSMNHHLLRCCFALQQSIIPPAISVAKRMHLHHRFNLSFNRRVSISNINNNLQSVITMSAHRERRISGSSDGNHTSSNNTEIQIINAEETARKKKKWTSQTSYGKGSAEGESYSTTANY